MAPFLSAAPEVSIELDGGGQAGVYNRTTETTRISGRVVVRLGRALAVGAVRVEFAGEEAVWLRAWAPLGGRTVSREVARQRATVHTGGMLGEGQHTFAFAVDVPAWVPSSLERDMCRIRYVVRAIVERATPAGQVGGGAWTAEETVECRRVRAARRLARRKRIDQSVGCPDGSCHVRFWGALSRDVVKPGAHVRVDVAARTSDARFGLRLLAAHFAEHVLCHVQVRGEERLVKRIRNLVTCRLDALGGGDGDGDGAEAADDAEWHADGSQRVSMRSDPGAAGGSDAEGGLARGLRKTRSRLAVLLRNASPPRQRLVRVQSAGAPASVPAEVLPPVPALPSTAVPASAPAATASSAHVLAAPRVVRQIRASQVIQIPSGLSQFSSEYVSREYRLMLVAEVAPLGDPVADAGSVHRFEAVVPAVACGEYSPAQSPQPTRRRGSSCSAQTAASVSSSSSTSSSSASASSFSTSSPSRARRRPATQESLCRVPSRSHVHTQAGGAQRWAVAEQASAIAGWPVEVVDHFDVQFDELVAPPSASRDPRREAVQRHAGARDPFIHVGRYSFEPASALGSLVSPAGTVASLGSGTHGSLTPSSEHGSADDGALGLLPNARRAYGHHRRTSSGLVGFLMRGFRSSSSSLSPSVSPRMDGGAGLLVSAPSAARHVRSASSGGRVNGCAGKSEEPRARGAAPEILVEGPPRSSATHLVRRHHNTPHTGADVGVGAGAGVDADADADADANAGRFLHPPLSAGAAHRPLRSHSAPFGAERGGDSESSAHGNANANANATVSSDGSAGSRGAGGGVHAKSPVLRRRPHR